MNDYNKIPTYQIMKDKTQKFPGERHVPLITDKGIRLANWSGPGTNIDTRLNGSSDIKEPVSAVDKSAMAHDLRYTLAKTTDGIRFADNKMISKLNDIERDKQDYRLNIIAVKNAMRSKRFFENATNQQGELFSNIKKGETIDDKSSADNKLKYSRELRKLEMNGFGLRF
jgi:hypothetical protein